MIRILFLCTGNSARSILAEALANHLGGGRLQAFSAGSFPKGEPHPMALLLLAKRGITGDFRSKSWDEFAVPDTLPIDIVITVCDNAAGEVCPIFPGRAIKAHWGIPDPAAVEGEGQRAAFETAFDQMRERIAALLELDLATLVSSNFAPQLAQIGRMSGATPGKDPIT
ncbi:arsenate reductase ArsC [Sphingomonas sp. 35-24ZXX]|uniref:arsenate reductase ArsC n=1 Tax=Sphingomonas sp. 35-24ZXX TaxID=1545915 RepID=UPI00053BE827|nr:arsenate reductase ArsC [Sphingomonas sp. 35-24ZXX]